jgi:two-component system chemotaxis response regulator CheY
MKFLIVDDSFVVRKSNEHHILSAFPDAEIIFAEDGKEALLLLLKKKICPDLILMDVNMPGLNGIETLKELKKSYDNFQVPVIMVTAEAKKELIVEMIKLGVSGYLVKPYKPKDLIDKILKL